MQAFPQSTTWTVPAKQEAQVDRLLEKFFVS